MENDDNTEKPKNRLAVFEHVVGKEKPKNRRFHLNRLSEDSSPSESELVIDDERPQTKKKNKKPIKLSEEILNLECEWNDCGERFDSYESFNTHLTGHVTAHHNDSPGELECKWTNCTDTVQTVSYLYQHISYHGYLAKLLNIGNNVIERNNLPKCSLPEEFNIPVSIAGYKCEWEDCDINAFITICDFFKHMQIHVKNNPKLCGPGEKITCYWTGCNNSFKTQYKLGEHVRVHTKERTVGCPSCGALFSCNTKFSDHRKRQLPMELQSYQCSQCLKLFPSERLLRDHMRSHINHYKCTMCDMTCPKPSILAKHIRYRHVKDKPFKCNHCGSKFVSSHNLKAHLLTHSKENKLACKECSFKCRSAYGLEHHYVKKHGRDSSQLYECHNCKQKFPRGGYLTKHLMKAHNYHWPSGHSRFRYRQDQDGIYRLQTVRYESLEVTEEMIRSENMKTSNVTPSSYTYSLNYANDKSTSYILTVSESKPADEVPVSNKNVLITIDDVDEEGNIVNSEVIESSEIIVQEMTLVDKVEEVQLPSSSSGKKEKNEKEKSNKRKRKSAKNGKNRNKIKIKCVESEDSLSLSIVKRRSSERISKKRKAELVKTEDNSKIHYFSEKVILSSEKFEFEHPK